MTVASGCKDDPGELDPDVVHDIARTPGDAVGLDLTGDYDAEVTPITCDCPFIGPLAGLSLCQGSSPGSTAPRETTFFALTVLQTDGLIVLRYEDLTLTGGLNADGSFSAGGIIDISTLLTSGDIITRIDGEFDDTAGIDQFEASIAHRLRGDVLALPDIDNETSSFDCVETFTLQATRRL